MDYDLLVSKFTNYTKERLLTLLVAEKGKPGWTKSRAVYLTALKRVACEKGINVSI